MKLKTRTQTIAPGILGTARVDRRTTSLLPRLAAGDVAVLDQFDLDGPTAEAMVEAGVVAVLNRSELISGRFPTRGPQILVDAGVAVVDRLQCADGGDVLSAIGDGRRVRVYDGAVLVGDRVVATGRELTPDDIAGQLAAARSGLTAQLQTLTHNSAEFLRREESLVLQGEGVPHLRTPLEGRPVVLLADGPDDAHELRLLRRYLTEVRPVIVAVGQGLDVASAAGLRPDIVVLSARIEELPPAKALRAARDVVVTETSGGTQTVRTVLDRFDRISVRPVTLRTTAALDDAALLLLDAAGARPIVTVGVRGTLEELLDNSRGGLASGYVTRLKTGHHVVEAALVPALYSGQLRARHAYTVLLAGLLAVAAAIATTHVGQQWATDLGHQLAQLLTSLRGHLS
jgi:uncharacterized membrane-anchored protein